MSVSRRTWLQRAAGATLVGIAGCSHGTQAVQTQAKPERPPALPDDLVRKFVGVCHSDFDAVRALLAETPSLVNATWDWSAGDFETGLGAASHTGRREIALHLLENGARLDIFAATMLGRIEIVRATLAAWPEALHTPGPHGIPLIAHAKVGGDEAAEVLAFLESLS